MKKKNKIINFKKPEIPNEFLHSTDYRPVYCEYCGDLIGIETISTGQKDYDGNFCRRCGCRIDKKIQKDSING